jgi:hypothetical protein
MKCEVCGIERTSTDSPCQVCGTAAKKESQTTVIPQQATAKITGNGSGCAGILLVSTGTLMLLFIFIFPFGNILLRIAVGTLLILAGRFVSKPLRCGNCGNRIESRQVKLCPVCHFTLTE